MQPASHALVSAGYPVRLPDSEDAGLQISRGVAEKVEMVERIQAELVAAAVRDAVVREAIEGVDDLSDGQVGVIIGIEPVTQSGGVTEWKIKGRVDG